MSHLTDLIERLRNGCVNHPRRWSGDTHDDLGGSVDETATDAVMREAADALEAEKADAERFRVLPGLLAPGGLAINRWMVQVRPQDANYQTVYFADPPSGTPASKEDSALDALRTAVDRTISAEAARKVRVND